MPVPLRDLLDAACIGNRRHFAGRETANAAAHEIESISACPRRDNRAPRLKGAAGQSACADLLCLLARIASARDRLLASDCASCRDCSSKP